MFDGGREGGPRRQKGGEGVGFFMENPRRAGVCQERGGWGGARGAGRVSAGKGGGANFFFSGPKFPPSKLRGP